MIGANRTCSFPSQRGVQVSKTDRDEALHGRCACGSVRYTLISPPMFVHCCHCRDCQRQSGSAFVLNALIETDRIAVVGNGPVVTAVPTDSGRPHDVYRCQVCQTALWSDYGRRPSLRFVRVGTLDEPATLPPDVHIFIRSKLPWVALPDAMPSCEIYYDMQSLWPAESLARRRVILGSN